MVTEMEMTVWIRLVQGSEKVKDQDVDEAHGKSEGVTVLNIKTYSNNIFYFILIYTLKQLSEPRDKVNAQTNIDKNVDNPMT